MRCKPEHFLCLNFRVIRDRVLSLEVKEIVMILITFLQHSSSSHVSFLFLPFNCSKLKINDFQLIHLNLCLMSHGMESNPNLLISFLSSLNIHSTIFDLLFVLLFHLILIDIKFNHTQLC